MNAGARPPERTCVGCRRRRPQTALVRLTLSTDGTIVVGRLGPGRGAWLCADDLRCVELAVERHALARAFRRAVAPAQEEQLRARLAWEGAENRAH